MLLMTLVVLCGCDFPAKSTQTTPTLQQILLHARTADLTDAMLTVTLDATVQGKPATGNGMLEFTTHPERLDLRFTVTSGPSDLIIEAIADRGTNVSYIRTSGYSTLTGSRWKKTQGTVDFVSFEQVLAYRNLAKAQLVGSEMRQNKSVWHIRGSIIAQSGVPVADVYLRKDIYLPVEVVITSSDHLVGQIVYVYKSLNTGISISLPPADQVDSSNGLLLPDAP